MTLVDEREQPAANRRITNARRAARRDRQLFFFLDVKEARLSLPVETGQL
jgi:hypothetical protein